LGLLARRLLTVDYGDGIWICHLFFPEIMALVVAVVAVAGVAAAV
jgi:hypothetical protein